MQHGGSLVFGTATARAQHGFQRCRAGCLTRSGHKSQSVVCFCERGEVHGKHEVAHLVCDRNLDLTLAS